MRTPQELLDLAVKFRLDPDICVEKRGEGQWAVTTPSGCCVNTDLRQEYEPLPSNRSAEMLARTRFSLEDALDLADRYIAHRDGQAHAG